MRLIGQFPTRARDKQPGQWVGLIEIDTTKLKAIAMTIATVARKRRRTGKSVRAVRAAGRNSNGSQETVLNGSS